MANAEARARTLVEEAEHRSAALTADAEERLAKIRIERETVAGYLENLKGALQQVESVASEQ